MPPRACLLPVACQIVLCTAAGAQESTTQANATLIAPMTIVASEGLSFGTLAVSNTGDCLYEIAPTGEATKGGDSACAFLSGSPLPARFEVDCGAGALVRIELIHASLSPDGAVFAATARPMAVDGIGAGAAMQVLPCDKDGRSVIHAGGRLTTKPAAAKGFSGRVGTIRLEVTYD